MPSKTRSHIPASSIAASAFTVLAARVEARFETAEDRQWCHDAGPLTPRDVGPVGDLADMAARAAAHGQVELASTLSAAVAALDALRSEPLAA
jgi:hypothetical protein